MTNVEMVEMTDNYFGFPLELPLVLVSYQRSSGSCREPVPYSQVNKVDMMRNMALKADRTLVELKHSYSEDLVCQQNTDCTASNGRSPVLAW